MATKTKEQLYDVVAVTIERQCTVRLINGGQTRENAEAVQKMAVMRRGCDEEFFSVVPAGMYSDGEKWRGNGRSK